MRVLYLGDIIGEIGREAVRFLSKPLLEKYKPDFYLANAENASNGRGLTKKDYLELLSYGLDGLSMGNHVLGKAQILTYITMADRLCCPLNMNLFKEHGSIVLRKGDKVLRLTNLLGEGFMSPTPDESPFDALEVLLNKHKEMFHIVDFHAESTSEKALLAHYFKGKVSAVLGTHTHVQTNDAQIIEGTAFLTDLGACRYKKGIIGFEPSSVIEKLIDGSDKPFYIPYRGEAVVSGVYLEFDEKGRATKIENISEDIYVK